MEDRAARRAHRRPGRCRTGRWDSATATTGIGRWNLDLGDVVPALDRCTSPTRRGRRGAAAALRRPRRLGRGAAPRGAGAPGRRAAGHHGVRPDARPVRRAPRRACPATWPTGYDDAAEPYTPAWQEPITGVPAAQAIRDRAGDSPRNAEESGGRIMIIMGAGICQWFHGDATYRAVLALLLLTGSMGRNGGGWAHYVGQEKCRPVTGWATMAMATDWQRPPRQMIGTAYWYTHTDQWRYDGYRADALTSPAGDGAASRACTRWTRSRSSARLGWMPSYPQFDRNPLDVADEAAAAGQETPRLRRRAAARRQAEVRDRPIRTPRRTGRACLTLWRANLLGSSAKGDEYFLQAPARHPRTTCRPTSAARAQAARRRLARRRPPRASSTCCCRSTSG